MCVCVKEWEDKRKLEGVSYASFWNKEDFDQVDPDKVDYMLGTYLHSLPHKTDKALFVTLMLIRNIHNV